MLWKAKLIAYLCIKDAITKVYTIFKNQKFADSTPVAEFVVNKKMRQVKVQTLWCTLLPLL